MINKNLQYFTTFLLSISFVLSPISPVFATDDFNPNFLISDEEIQDWQSMNRPDIQAFLNDQGGYISTLRTEDKDGETRLSSDIIYRAAKEYSISPKYLLVKLQKEQSLITTKNPTQKQLDGATGYGITDGCGWDCDVYKRNKGFGKQVDSAAGIIRWYYDNVANQGFIKKSGVTYNIDNQQITPANLATAFLYTYTPHIQGNKNFWSLWQKWFDQVYPDGTLVKVVGGDTVYLIENGKKRPFATFSALATRFDPKFIIESPSSELARYEQGNSISLPNYSILKQGNSYYLLDYNTLKKFESESVVRQLGFHPDETIDITAQDLAGYSISSAIITASSASAQGHIIKAKETGGIYFVKDNSFYSITDKQIVELNFPTFSIESGSLSELSQLSDAGPMLFRDGTLVGVTGFNKIYVIEKGKKRHIASEDVFNGLGYNWDNIIWIDEISGTLHPNGQPIYLRREIPTTESPTTVADISEESEVGNIVSTDTTIDGHEDLVRTPENVSEYIGEKLSSTLEAYLIADYDTEEILAGKNIDVVRPMASLTKVITAYRAMSEGFNLNGSTTYNSSKHKAPYHRFRIVDGERIKNSDLMDAMLVSSLNTASRMIASDVEENESFFIKRMNDQITSWGLNKTKIVDTSGVDVGNVTTAREYMKIFKTVSSNSDLKPYLGRKSYEYSELIDIDEKPNHFDANTNKLLSKSNLNFDIVATKTGYLHEAGPTVAMVIQRRSDKKKFIVISMGNHNLSDKFSEPERIVNIAVGQF